MYKPTGSHEVDFVIGNKRDYSNYKISCLKGGGGGLLERGDLLQNKRGRRGLNI